MKNLKKNLHHKMYRTLNAKVFFFDESRFGTHSKIGHGWFKRGSRTPIKVKLGFQNFYVYGAVNHLSGEMISLILPHVNAYCLTIFLKEMSHQFPNDQIILVLDGAGWHRAKDLEIPQNIEIVYLPPYSPELNPIERLWQHIKRYTIRNKIYDSLNHLETEIELFIRKIPQADISSICSCNYL